MRSDHSVLALGKYSLHFHENATCTIFVTLDFVLVLQKDASKFISKVKTFVFAPEMLFFTLRAKE